MKTLMKMALPLQRFCALTALLMLVCFAKAETTEIPITVYRSAGLGYANQVVSYDQNEVLSILGAGNWSQVATYPVVLTTGQKGTDYDGWRDINGDPIGWNAGQMGLCLKYPHDGSMDLCTFPGGYDPAVGESRKASWSCSYGDNEVILAVTVNFVSELPKSVDIVRTIELTHYETPNAAYSETEAAPTFDVDEVMEALGVSSLAGAESFIMNADGSVWENTTDGWRDNDGNRAPWASATNGFCLKIANPASGKVSYTGAHDTNFNEGDTYVARHVIAMNGKGVVIQVNVIFGTEPNAGELTFDIVKTIDTYCFDIANTGYSTSEPNPTFSVSEVCTALGIADITAAEKYIVNVTDGSYHENTTDGWRDANGDMAGWGTAGGVCVKLNNPETGAFDYVGCDDDTHNNGDTYLAKWALTHDGKAVILNVNITFGKSATMSVNAAAQYGTFCAPFDVAVPAGVTASTATLNADGKTIDLTSVGATIPANTPVILYAEAGLTATTFYGAAVENEPKAGILVGVYAETTVPKGAYVLQKHGEKDAAFYVVGETAINPLAANRCYLVRPSSANAPERLSFSFDNEATGIEGISAIANGEAEAVFNTSGVKQNGLQKGLNIVKLANGKTVKVMVK